MKKKSFFVVSGIVALYSILMMKENYRTNSLTPSYEQLTPFVQEQKGVEVSYRALSAEESKLYLDRDLLDRGYQPIHITVQNNSPDRYQIDPKLISLPGASPSDVAMQISKKAIPRAVGYKVASLFFWPFMIPSTIDSVKTYKAHKMMKKSFAAKALKEETIGPYSTVHRMHYVPIEEYKEQFSLALVNLDTEESVSFESFSQQ